MKKMFGNFLSLLDRQKYDLFQKLQKQSNLKVQLEVSLLVKRLQMAMNREL